MVRACHICGSPLFEAESFVRCANIRETLANGAPLCTKVICRSCFQEYGWDFAAARRNDGWTCTHCREECPKCAPVADAYGNDMIAPPATLQGQLAQAERAGQVHA